MMNQIMQDDLAKGARLFRKGHYDEALLCLERCFLNAFAANDPRRGGESGVLLLKTLVALGRHREAVGFALGVRGFCQSSQVVQIESLLNARRQNAARRLGVLSRTENAAAPVAG